MGIASLILGIFSLVFAVIGAVATIYGVAVDIVAVIFGIVGIILGAIGKKKHAKCATGGLVCSIIGTAIASIVFIACVIAASSYTYF